MNLAYKVCPVCGEERKEKGLRNHILNKAKTESWKKEQKIIQETPHLDYAEKNYRESGSKKLII